MVVNWFGHSCFRLQGKKASVLIDPFSKDIGLKPPNIIKDSAVLITHDHYDHANVKNAGEDVTIIKGPGEYETKGVYVKGIKSYHDEKEGEERGLNTIYVIEFEGLNICHMGDFGQKELEEHQLEEMGDVDILMIPVGGKYTIDGKKAVAETTRIEPRVVIPMHYKIPKLKLDILPVDGFLKEIGIEAERVSKLKIDRKDLPQDNIKLIVFNNPQ